MAQLSMSYEKSNLLAVADVKRVFTLLEQLRVGFVLVDPDRRVSHITLQARALLGRRRTGASAEGIFGPDRFDELWVAAGGSDSRGGTARIGGWREWSVEALDGDQIDCAVCGLPVAFEDGRRGLLIAVEDVSAEASLHRKYRLLLDEQREIAGHLQRQIAARLREHEDDISQFAEILQIAPVVFSAFESEAATALELCSQALPAPSDGRDEAIDSRLRALHTLKGNARSLGLNFIGGRAHAAEGMLAALRRRYGQEQAQELDELLVDLARAVKRAAVIRKRLGETTREQASGLDLKQHEELVRVQELVERAEKQLADATPGDAPSQQANARARQLLREARQRLEDEARVPLQPLFDYLKVVAVDAAKDVHSVCPEMTFSGGALAVTPSAFRALQAALPHLVRNAVVHGIESDEERLALGKAAAGNIWLSAQRDQALVRLWLRDDGRGLVLDKLREHGEREADAAALMFASGVSTAERVSLTAGRGVGAASAKEAIEEMGGSIEVRSDEHVGLELAISLPQ